MTSILILFVSLAILLGAFAFVAVPAASRGRRVIIVGFFALASALFSLAILT